MTERGVLVEKNVLCSFLLKKFKNSNILITEFRFSNIHTKKKKNCTHKHIGYNFIFPIFIYILTAITKKRDVVTKGQRGF